MATQIAVYREAARLIQDARLATLTDDGPGRFAFDDAWPKVVEFCLADGFWNFAMKTVVPEASAIAPLAGYTIVYDLPCDWIATHAIFILDDTSPIECPIDLKYQLEQLHTNIAPINLRYVSNDFADPEVWVEPFAYAVACRLAYATAERITGNPDKTTQMAALYKEAIEQASQYRLGADDWLRYQLNGTFYRGSRWMLDQHAWNFAIKTVELTGTTSGVSPGYTYAAFKPDDLGRTFHYYYPVGMEWCDIDFRDEDGRFHSNYQNTVLRYVSTDGEDSTNWSDGFRRALLAYLQYQEAMATPGMAGAQLQAREMAFKDAYKTAKLKDSMNERPRFNDVGVLVRARRGGTTWGRSREQGWWG